MADDNDKYSHPHYSLEFERKIAIIALGFMDAARDVLKDDPSRKRPRTSYLQMARGKAMVALELLEDVLEGNA